MQDKKKFFLSPQNLPKLNVLPLHTVYFHGLRKSILFLGMDGLAYGLILNSHVPGYTQKNLRS